MALLLLVSAAAGHLFSPARAQSDRTRTTEDEKMTPDRGCIRLMTEHRLYITEGRIPTDNTLEAAILCTRAPLSLCQRAMTELRERRAPLWGRYVMECKGK
jgi:hypothetical protein